MQPEFGIEKRVHVDKMPLKNSVYDEHADKLSYVACYAMSETTS